MLTRGIYFVRSWLLVEQLDVAHERRAREEALEQVVGEEGILGRSPGEGRGERVDVVDRLAGIRAFAEQVLVNVRDGCRVRVDARRSGAQRRVARASRAQGQRPHAR